MLKVLLIGEMTLTRTGIRALLENSEQVEVVGEAANRSEALQLVQKLIPEVVLIETAKPAADGIETARHIHATQPHIRILMLSMSMAGQHVFDSLRAGASGYVPHQATLGELLTALQTVVAGGTYLSPSLSNVAMEDYVRMAQGGNNVIVGKLSAREREVLRLIAEGHSSAEIGRRLHVSPRTVDTHRHNIMKKLNIHSVAGLTKFAVKHGLCSL